MHKIRHNNSIERVYRFIDRLKKNILGEAVTLDAKYFLTPNQEHIKFEDRLNGSYKQITEGEKWGKTWDSAWFHITGKVPANWKGKTVAANLDFNGEALIFDETGCPKYGLTNGSVFDAHHNKDIYRMFEPSKGTETVELWIETAANKLSGIQQEQDPTPESKHLHGQYLGQVNKLKLCVFNDEVWHLWLDYVVLFSLFNSIQNETPRWRKMLKVMQDAINVYAETVENASAARTILKGLWTPANASDMKVTGIGHAHIDTGWLWPVKESVRKCARTFASQINLIERYPDYIFGASQPQHYKFVKENYPALYEKIKKYVKEGRWELQGGMWVEADCNIISGESMIRQFVHGKNFFMDEFDIEVKNLWLPDVFGYSAAMPQILKKSGVDFFLTQKISWNQFNKFPFYIFNWRGIDGTEVVTHFLPEHESNAEVLPKNAIGGQNNFTESDIINEYVSLFGIGNGGGGPKEEYIERGERMKNLENCPKWTFGKAEDALERMKDFSKEFNTWSGELYLEYHRGTYTTQALTKKLNRKLENTLRFVEYIYSCLPLEEYPAEELKELWRVLLINQFHDIIPGTSIKVVYDTTTKEHVAALQTCAELIDNASSKLFLKKENCITVSNILSFDYTQKVKLPASWTGCEVLDCQNNKLDVQQDSDGIFTIANLPANSFVALTKGATAQSCSEKLQELVLENDLIRYEFNNKGSLISIFDKEAQKEVLQAPGNIFSIYEDQPLTFDAWDIEIYYEDQFIENSKNVKAEPLTTGSVFSAIKFTHSVAKNSTLTQKIVLSSNSKQLDFETKVDWNESHKMLRVAFPVDVLSNEFTSDIQYGTVKRPTHRNTSWDMAKFESVAHKFVDLSDNGYGVALLNDCKYGHKVFNNVIDLNLLRSPKYPDPEADLGKHEFTYSLLPHTGTLVESDVIAQSQMLNIKPFIFENFATNSVKTPCAVTGDGISLEVVKKAEKEDCLIIRLVELNGRDSSATLTFDNKNAKLTETNMMEWIDAKTSISTSEPIDIKMSPFEIRTYKIR
ncbi:MAG: glycosyl hydrolase-related protein [Kiritimatiellae bacterium]|jgi:alpha-mannosidase|nr:glycosyl hydrolase-related protein [Kiritimatiellia bacterium]